MRTGLEVWRKPIEIALRVWGRVRIIPASPHQSQLKPSG